MLIEALFVIAKQNKTGGKTQIALFIKWLNKLSYYSYIRGYCTVMKITELQLNIFKGMNHKHKVGQKKAICRKNAFSMIHIYMNFKNMNN